MPLEQAAAELGAVLGLTGEQVKGIIDAELAENPESDYAYVAKLVDTATYERVKALDIPWVVPCEHPSRRLPERRGRRQPPRLRRRPTAALAGLELSEDDCLAGEDGELSYLHSLEDWVQIPGTEVIHKQARDGGTLHLTIDSDLQWMRAAHRRGAGAGGRRRLGDRHRAWRRRPAGSSPWPTCRRSTPTTRRATRRGEPRVARRSRAPFEPGSTFKAITAASVIDGGKADPLSQSSRPTATCRRTGRTSTTACYHERRAADR